MTITSGTPVQKGSRAISLTLLSLAAVVVGAINAAGTEPGSADKGQYTLFNPTPRELMREMSTDRPDLTESAFTVDAGHFQIEMDAVNYAYNDDSSIRTETLGIGIINLKAGLCNRADFQVIIESYNSVRVRDRATGTTERHRGFGDITTRL